MTKLKAVVARKSEMEHNNISHFPSKFWNFLENFLKLSQKFPESFLSIPIPNTDSAGSKSFDRFKKCLKLRKLCKHEMASRFLIIFAILVFQINLRFGFGVFCRRVGEKKKSPIRGLQSCLKLRKINIFRNGQKI